MHKHKPPHAWHLEKKMQKEQRLTVLCKRHCVHTVRAELLGRTFCRKDN